MYGMRCAPSKRSSGMSFRVFVLRERLRLSLLVFRAAYKLKGTERGLNFPLTTAEKAELDSVSEAAYLASVQVEKEKLSWLRTKGKSKFRGVETRRNGQWGTKWSRKIFTSEEEAAAEFDRGYLEEMGPTAMTNAKYHADLETRERAWEERRQALEKAFESGTGMPCCSGCGDKVQGNRHCCIASLPRGEWLPALQEACSILFMRTIRSSYLLFALTSLCQECDTLNTASSAGLKREPVLLPSPLRQGYLRVCAPWAGDLSLRSYKGVFRTSQGWAAKVQIRGNCLRSTVYDTRKEAAECYDRYDLLFF